MGYEGKGEDVEINTALVSTRVFPRISETDIYVIGCIIYLWIIGSCTGYIRIVLDKDTTTVKLQPYLIGGADIILKSGIYST